MVSAICFTNNFRCRFFTYGEDTREARRMKQAELRAHGKRMAMLHRRKVDAVDAVDANDDSSAVNSK